VGSLSTWEQDPGDWVPLVNEVCIPVNRFLVSETINGLCTAYFYVYSNEEPDSAGYPVLYSDNNNTPLSKRSIQESYIDLQVKSGKLAGWRSGTMRSSQSIASGSYIWFGVSTEFFWYARFDYGSRLYCDDNSGGLLPTTYPLYNANFYYNFKPSMYFTYSSAQAYTRTLTQGVTLLDTRKPAGVYQRNVTQTVGGTTTAKGLAGFYRNIIQSVKNTVILQGSPMRIVRLIEAAAALHKMKAGAAFNRGTADTAGINSTAGGAVLFFRTLFGLAEGGDTNGGLVTRIRILQDTKAIGDKTGHVADYLRGLFVEAGNRAETVHEGDYYRTVEDTAHNEAIPLRHLFIFIRLATLSLVRDYLIGRFLKSKEEVIIKSPVCREITLDSTLH
jgi:hypothetical protein